MDVLAEPEGNPDAAILLLTGEHEYPEFQPDQARLHQALARRSPATDHRIVPGLAHMFAENPGTPTKADEAVAEAAQDWLLRHFVH
jgi:dienelactone hydrolase